MSTLLDRVFESEGVGFELYPLLMFNIVMLTGSDHDLLREVQGKYASNQVVLLFPRYLGFFLPIVMQPPSRFEAHKLTQSLTLAKRGFPGFPL